MTPDEQAACLSSDRLHVRILSRLQEFLTVGAFFFIHAKEAGEGECTPVAQRMLSLCSLIDTMKAYRADVTGSRFPSLLHKYCDRFEPRRTMDVFHEAHSQRKIGGVYKSAAKTFSVSIASRMFSFAGRRTSIPFFAAPSESPEFD